MDWKPADPRHFSESPPPFRWLDLARKLPPTVMSCSPPNSLVRRSISWATTSAASPASVVIITQHSFDQGMARRDQISFDFPGASFAPSPLRHHGHINIRGSSKFLKGRSLVRFIKHGKPVSAMKSSKSSPLRSVIGDLHREDLELASMPIMTLLSAESYPWFCGALPRTPPWEPSVSCNMTLLLVASQIISKFSIFLYL
jgi:hypothetical protein